MYDNKIILNLIGEPSQDSICLPSGYGHYAYVSTKNAFIKNLFKDISIWGGSTDTHETIEGKYYSQYELDCRDKSFFKSDSFKRICQRNSIEIVIQDENSEENYLKEFWHQVKRR